jgi:catechol 2,3-dioxygenase-like lactoylglutathione lyase family enzyme
MDAQLVLNQVNLVVRDMAATRKFYERLGVKFKDGPAEWEFSRCHEPMDRSKGFPPPAPPT